MTLFSLRGKRYPARRGVPCAIWSNNATNFVSDKNVLERYCQSSGIRWKFIAPRSPHQGGVWEVTFRSGTSHLVSAARNVVLTTEQFTTVLVQIEAILNSHPLYQHSHVWSFSGKLIWLHSAQPKTRILLRLKQQGIILRSF